METIDSYQAWTGKRRSDGMVVHMTPVNPTSEVLFPLGENFPARYWRFDKDLGPGLIYPYEVPEVWYAGVMVISRWWEKQEGKGTLPWKVTTTVTLAGREIYHAVVCTEQVRLPESLTPGPLSPLPKSLPINGEGLVREGRKADAKNGVPTIGDWGS